MFSHKRDKFFNLYTVIKFLSPSVPFISKYKCTYIRQLVQPQSEFIDAVLSVNAVEHTHTLSLSLSLSLSTLAIGSCKRKPAHGVIYRPRRGARPERRRSAPVLSPPRPIWARERVQEVRVQLLPLVRLVPPQDPVARRHRGNTAGERAVCLRFHGTGWVERNINNFRYHGRDLCENYGGCVCVWHWGGDIWQVVS